MVVNFHNNSVSMPSIGAFRKAKLVCEAEGGELWLPGRVKKVDGVNSSLLMTDGRGDTRSFRSDDDVDFEDTEHVQGYG